MRISDIAFAVAIMAIGYELLPIQAPDWLSWVASITLIFVGLYIIVRAIREVRELY